MGGAEVDVLEYTGCEVMQSSDPEAHCEGVSVTEDSNLPPILQAIVDATKSTIDAQDVDVDFDDKSVAVNFQGLGADRGCERRQEALYLVDPASPGVTGGRDGG
jgi:hypothetical protein